MSVNFSDNDICGEDEFTCADGTCIHVSEVCDYKWDCSDKSDEFCGMFCLQINVNKLRCYLYSV